MREAQVSARFRTIGRDLQSRLKDFFDGPVDNIAAAWTPEGPSD